MEPRKVIGSVDTSEFCVALGASAGLLFSLGSERLDLGVVAALLAGGVIAAYRVRLLPPRVLGAAVGGIIIVTNLDTLAGPIGLRDATLALAYAVVALAWLAALAVAVRAVRREPRTQTA
jgi:uncharacterized protein